MDADGTKSGYDLDLTRMVSRRVSVPVIASGGAGSKEHFADVLGERGGADAALAASLFHFCPSAFFMPASFFCAFYIFTRYIFTRYKFTHFTQPLHLL
jgi:hypothetical protein